MALTKVSRGLLSTGIVDNSTTTAITIDSSENVGIGTSSPVRPLSVKASQEQLTLSEGDARGATFDYSSATGNLNIATNGINARTNPQFTLDLNGNVGIGTGTIIGSAANRGVLTLSGASSSFLTFGTGATRWGGVYSSASSTIFLSDSISTFETGGTERMRIDSSGSLLVGTSSVLFNNRSLQVKANAGNDAAVIQSTAVSAKTLLCWNNVTSGNNEFIGFLTEAGGTQRGLIDYNRSVGQVRYNITSDARLKDNIQNAEESGSLIDSIQVRQYDLKETSHHVNFGFIAQELQVVAPEAVAGDADSEEMMGVDYSKLVPMLVKEIQSLRTRVQELENN